MLGRFRNPNRRPQSESSSHTLERDKRWFQAVNRNDIETVRSLLAGSDVVNARDKAGNSALIVASQGGNSAMVNLLLEHDALLDLQNKKGQTALHQAARRRHVEIAATLLIYGADFQKQNAKRQTPLDASRIPIETLHAIRQHYHRAPCPSKVASGPHSAEAARLLAELRDNGFVKLSNFIQPGELQQLKTDFNDFIESVQRKTEQGDGHFSHYDEEEYWRPDDAIFVTNNVFKYSTQLAKLCWHELISDLATCYFGKPTFIQRAVAMRYLPREEMNAAQFRWHHDMEEKRFKMMILLTDVGPQGQRMSYANGTHAILHPYERFLGNALDFDYCRQHVKEPEIAETTGQAGDIFFFDSNGMHRGIRSREAIRDAIFVEYTSDTSNVWGGDIPSEFVKPNALGISPFQNMAAVKQKKWERDLVRTKPTWAYQLPQVESWIVPSGVNRAATGEGHATRGEVPLRRAG